MSVEFNGALSIDSHINEPKETAIQGRLGIAQRINGILYPEQDILRNMKLKNVVFKLSPSSYVQNKNAEQMCFSET